MSLTVYKEVEIEIDEGEILDYVGNMSTRDTIEFIKEIDSNVGDWDFTKQLIQVFYQAWRDENPEEELELSDRVLRPICEQDSEVKGEAMVSCATDEPKDEPTHYHVFQSDGRCGCGESISRD